MMVNKTATFKLLSNHPWQLHFSKVKQSSPSVKPFPDPSRGKQVLGERSSRCALLHSISPTPRLPHWAAGGVCRLPARVELIAFPAEQKAQPLFHLAPRSRPVPTRPDPTQSLGAERRERGCDTPGFPSSYQPFSVSRFASWQTPPVIKPMIASVQIHVLDAKQEHCGLYFLFHFFLSLCGRFLFFLSLSPLILIYTYDRLKLGWSLTDIETASGNFGKGIAQQQVKAKHNFAIRG